MLISFGLFLFGTGSFDFESKEFLFRYDNSSSIVEYSVGILLVISGLILIFKKNIEDSRIASHRENYLFYISDKVLDSKDSFNKSFLPEEGRTNLSRTQRKIDTYKKEDVAESYINARNFEIKPRSKNKNVENTYIAGLGSFPHLYLMGSHFGSAYDSNIEVLDFDRKKQVWHILENVGTNIKYKINFEDIEVNKKVDSLKYNGNIEVGIAISNSFTIEKNSVPQDLVDDTLFLVLDDEIGINSVDGLISQNSLLEQLTNIMGELSNTKDKIHLFVAARASFCIRFGTHYMPKTYPTIVLHNYNKDTKQRDWSIELKDGNIIKG